MCKSQALLGPWCSGFTINQGCAIFRLNPSRHLRTALLSHSFLARLWLQWPLSCSPSLHSGSCSPIFHIICSPHLPWLLEESTSVYISLGHSLACSPSAVSHSSWGGLHRSHLDFPAHMLPAQPLALPPLPPAPVHNDLSSGPQTREVL